MISRIVCAAFLVTLAHMPAVPVSAQDACETGLIGDVDPDLQGLVSFQAFSAKQLGEPEMSLASSLRVGEPFMVTADFRWGGDDVLSIFRDIDCEFGWIELQQDPPAGSTVRVRVQRTGRLSYGSRTLMLSYESGGGSDVVVVAPRDSRSELVARPAANNPKILERGKTILPPYEAGMGSLTVRIETDASGLNEGVLTVRGPDGFAVRTTGRFFSRSVPAGSYSATFEVMGSSIEFTGITLAAGEDRRVEFGGPENFGRVGWTREGARFFWLVLGFRWNGSCRFSREGTVVLEGSCSYNTLPKGDYDLSVGPAVFTATSRITVTPGMQVVDRPPELGLLVLSDAVYSESTGRRLVAQIRRSAESSAEIEFGRDTTLVLPVGEYIVEVSEVGVEGTQERVTRINPARATFFEVGAMPSEGRAAVARIEYLVDMEELRWGNLFAGFIKFPDRLWGGYTEGSKGLLTSPEDGGIIGFVEYELDGSFQTFHAIVGQKGPVTTCRESRFEENRKIGYRVLVDGVQKEGGMSSYSTRTINVNVEGAKLLRLEVDDGGDGYECDHLEWVDAYLVR